MKQDSDNPHNLPHEGSDFDSSSLDQAPLDQALTGYRQRLSQAADGEKNNEIDVWQAIAPALQDDVTAGTEIEIKTQHTHKIPPYLPSDENVWLGAYADGVYDSKDPEALRFEKAATAGNLQAIEAMEMVGTLQTLSTEIQAYGHRCKEACSIDVTAAVMTDFQNGKTDRQLIPFYSGWSPKTARWAVPSLAGAAAVALILLIQPIDFASKQKTLGTFWKHQASQTIASSSLTPLSPVDASQPSPAANNSLLEEVTPLPTGMASPLKDDSANQGSRMSQSSPSTVSGLVSQRRAEQDRRLKMELALQERVLREIQKNGGRFPNDGLIAQGISNDRVRSTLIASRTDPTQEMFTRVQGFFANPLGAFLEQRNIKSQTATKFPGVQNAPQRPRAIPIERIPSAEEYLFYGCQQALPEPAQVDSADVMASCMPDV